jgi:hypothetical protein
MDRKIQDLGPPGETQAVPRLGGRPREAPRPHHLGLQPHRADGGADLDGEAGVRPQARGQFDSEAAASHIRGPTAPFT